MQGRPCWSITTVPQITFDIVAGDDIVNIAEHGGR